MFPARVTAIAGISAANHKLLAYKNVPVHLIYGRKFMRYSSFQLTHKERLLDQYFDCFY
jgi:hypothetical protein